MLKHLLIIFLEKVHPTYKILNKEFFELNKQINFIESQLIHTRNVLQSISEKNGGTLVRKHSFQTENGLLCFEYSIFNEHDFKEIVKEILIPNYYEIDKSATYYFKDITFKENDVVVDIGANIGLFSIPLAKAFPYIKIYCYEPLSKNADMLEKNILLNSIKNIEVIRKGVSDKNQKEIFQWNPFHNGNAGTTSLQFSQNHPIIYAIENQIEYEEVDLVSFDDEMKRLGISKVKLLKMDCEGGEYNIVFRSNFFSNANIDELRGEVHLLGDNDFVAKYRHLSDKIRSEFADKCRMDCLEAYDKLYCN